MTVPTGWTGGCPLTEWAMVKNSDLASSVGTGATSGASSGWIAPSAENADDWGTRTIDYTKTAPPGTYAG